MRSVIHQQVSVTHDPNNFDFVRFVASSAVLYSHCFAITAFGGDEPLVRLTRGEYAFGGLAVRVFFVISGFLVTRSWLRSPRLLAFVSARCLRIFPGLAVALCYCILLGAIATTLTMRDFLAHPDTFRFFWHNLILRTEFQLPAVFSKNPLPNAINGSLWSLYYEIRAYMVVILLGVLWLMRKRWLGTLSWLIAGSMIFLYRDFWGLNIDHDWPVINAYVCFVAGALVALNLQVLRWLGYVALLAAVLLPFLIGTLLSNPVMDIFLVSGTLAFAQRPLPGVSSFGRYGDFSYGVYIYAFPTQQMLAWCGLTGSPFALFAAAFPLTLGLAIMSWYGVERPCLNLKRFFKRKPMLMTPETANTPLQA